MSRPLRLYDAPPISESPIAVTGPAEKPEHLVALGANLPSALGDPRATLEAALAAPRRPRPRGDGAEPLVPDERLPPGSGPDYVNGAVRLAASQPPEAVLAALHAVEDELGRRRGRRWGPRVCDLDLLASGGAVRPDRATVAAWIARTGDARATRRRASSCRTPASRSAPSCSCPSPRWRRAGDTRSSAAPSPSSSPPFPHPNAPTSARWPRETAAHPDDRRRESRHHHADRRKYAGRPTLSRRRFRPQRWRARRSFGRIRLVRRNVTPPG